MSYSGDAAEQVVRMSLETGEVAVKLAGSGAKQLAILLYAILREQKKTKGKTRLTNMLRSGKELKVFAVKDTDLRRFCVEAKKYGVLYCVLKDKDATDGITDVMVRAEDASKINRIFERFDLATVDMASVKSEIERDRAEQQADAPETPAAGPMTEQETEDLLDALLAPARPRSRNRPRRGNCPASRRVSCPSRSAQPQRRKRTSSFWRSCWDRPPPRRKARPKTPPRAGLRNPVSPSLPQSPKSQPHRVSLIRRGVPAPSVRQELNDIKAEQREKAASRERAKPTKGPKHMAPRKYKPKRLKER